MNALETPAPSTPRKRPEDIVMHAAIQRIVSDARYWNRELVKALTEYKSEAAGCRDTAHFKVCIHRCRAKVLISVAKGLRSEFRRLASEFEIARIHASHKRKMAAIERRMSKIRRAA